MSDTDDQTGRGGPTGSPEVPHTSRPPEGLWRVLPPPQTQEKRKKVQHPRRRVFSSYRSGTIGTCS